MAFEARLYFEDLSGGCGSGEWRCRVLGVVCLIMVGLKVVVNTVNTVTE